MFQDDEKLEAAKHAADESEPYRRLIELQKQMIELVQQHQKTKRECAGLRAHLLEQIVEPRRRRRSLLRISQSVIRWLKELAASWTFRLAGRASSIGSFFSRNRLLKT